MSRLKYKESEYFGLFAILVAAITIILIIPKKAKFSYEFETGNTWSYDDLSAPFSYAIEKTEDEIKSEIDFEQLQFKPFYQRVESIRDSSISEFKNLLEREQDFQNAKPKLKNELLSKGSFLLNQLYAKGVIKLDSAHKTRHDKLIISELLNSRATDHPYTDYYSSDDAVKFINDAVTKDTSLNKTFFTKAIRSSIHPNIIYNKELSEHTLQDIIKGISGYRGMVNEKEIIVRNGNLITPERFQKLISLQHEYESRISKGKKEGALTSGYTIIIFLTFLIFFLCLRIMHKNVLSDFRSLIIILGQILLFVFVTLWVINVKNLNVYMIPYCIAPIVLVSFLGIRISLLVHVVTIFLAGIIVSKGYQFILIELLAGTVAILTMARLRYTSQFFIATLLISLTYSISFFGFMLLETGNFEKLPLENFLWFGINFLLTLLAYPSIFLNEKLFGFLSDITLLELTDINNSLLKELALRAPGTFQHSLHVASLADAVVNKIGGNALLIRVGALYHDIGKMHRPEFFIENQQGGNNPHKLIGNRESATIIIDHVARGVEKAKENNLPPKIIDFIRTHHGTTRVEYFYQDFMSKQTNQNFDDIEFRYQGPKPTTKEQATLMLVDSVEAASRSLKSYDEESIDNLVDRIINLKISDNQLEFAQISLAEINTARRLLKKQLKSFYHVRVNYQEEVVR